MGTVRIVFLITAIITIPHKFLVPSVKGPDRAYAAGLRMRGGICHLEDKINSNLK